MSSQKAFVFSLIFMVLLIEFSCLLKSDSTRNQIDIDKHLPSVKSNYISSNKMYFFNSPNHQLKRSTTSTALLKMFQSMKFASYKGCLKKGIYKKICEYCLVMNCNLQAISYTEVKQL